MSKVLNHFTLKLLKFFIRSNENIQGALLSDQNTFSDVFKDPSVWCGFNCARNAGVKCEPKSQLKKKKKKRKEK